MNLETRIYQVLLKLYPREFRQEYGQEMTRVFQESLEQEGSSFGFWARTFWDAFSSASREHFLGGRIPLLTKFAGLTSVLLGVWLAVNLYRISHNMPGFQSTSLEIVARSVLILTTVIGLLAFPVKRRNGLWWFTVATLAVFVVLNLIAASLSNSRLTEWLILNGRSIFVAILCLNFVRIERTRLVFSPEFWGLALLTLGLIEQRFLQFSVVMFDSYISFSIAFVASWFVLGFALWSRASTPQPRALT
jgi:hypothetical protein